MAPAGREYAIMQTRMLLNLVAEESSMRIDHLSFAKMDGLNDVTSPAVHFANAKMHMEEVASAKATSDPLGAQTSSHVNGGDLEANPEAVGD
ncbi:hypothetical protein HDU90_001831 [Geranomyces variabilis]|nr:hypothetical protein HDU90_001831 [Geranomyces variabilis]